MSARRVTLEIHVSPVKSRHLPACDAGVRSIHFEYRDWPGGAHRRNSSAVCGKLLPGPISQFPDVAASAHDRKQFRAARAISRNFRTLPRMSGWSMR